MPSRSDPPQLLPMSAIEGAIDFVCGRPIDANPYFGDENRDAQFSWAFGWEYARDLLDLYGQREAARWLRTTDPKEGTE